MTVHFIIVRVCTIYLKKVEICRHKTRRHNRRIGIVHKSRPRFCGNFEPRSPRVRTFPPHKCMEITLYGRPYSSKNIELLKIDSRFEGVYTAEYSLCESPMMLICITEQQAWIKTKKKGCSVWLSQQWDGFFSDIWRRYLFAVFQLLAFLVCDINNQKSVNVQTVSLIWLSWIQC